MIIGNMPPEHLKVGSIVASIYDRRCKYLVRKVGLHFRGDGSAVWVVDVNAIYSDGRLMPNTYTDVSEVLFEPLSPSPEAGVSP
jgi:hypothetical protein